jgi:phosphoribosylaminoimidazole-succinocarboxamide synthase
MEMAESENCPVFKRGKVRDVYDVGNERLLIIATDRISAFDCISPTPIPEKGILLTQLSNFWFERTRDAVPNHIVNAAPEMPGWRDDQGRTPDQIAGRSVLVKKTRPLAIEAVVRGYLAGSGWKEYCQTGKVCGVSLPPGLTESDRLPEPIYTPATKAEEGMHDENIPFEDTVDIVGAAVAEQVRDISLKLYKTASEYARERGIIIADTKFEFGLFDGELLLIDEILTPDSSRFWPLDGYVPGGPQPSFDKQYVRDHLESLDWDKTPPAPELPSDIVEGTVARYREALHCLTAQRP